MLVYPIKVLENKPLPQKDPQPLPQFMVQTLLPQLKP